MRNYQFSTSPPPDWPALCQASSALFGSVDWQQLLETSFGCRTVYACNGQDGAAVTAFKAGPFSIGYVGFPTGSVTGNTASLTAIISQLMATKPALDLTCIRAPVSAFTASSDLELPYVSNPETAITDLQGWELMGVSKNLRRDIRKAERSGLSVCQSSDPGLGPILFDMYASAVKHHGGSLRYNADYFSSLLELAKLNPALQVFIASLDSDIVGFAVIVHHAGTAYYLHGGARADLRQLSPSDLILAEAIASAKSGGDDVFNFMASPPDQPTLVRYKEKWGGETRSLKTYTLRLSPAYPLFKAVERLYRLIS